jgi:predicted PurR-regulated permease PerM
MGGHVPDDTPRADPVPLASTWLFRAGTRAWLAIGVLVVVAGLISVMGVLSSVVGPLTVATLLAVLFVPVVDGLHRLRVPRAAGSVVVLLSLAAIVVWSVWLTVTALADQGAEIVGALANAFNALDRWLSDLGADDAVPAGVADAMQAALRDAVGGLAAWLSASVGGAVSGVWAIAISSIVGAFFLFYILSDWRDVVRWVGSRVPSRDVPGDELVGAAVGSVRRYFVGLTLSTLVTVVVIGGTALLLGIPLWLTIALVTFVTSYVPYLGAVVSGAFATLVALGTQGPDAAVVMLVVVLLVQNVLQTIVCTKLTSDQLHIHPIVNLASTLVGASLGGIIGATLASPVVATVIRVRRLVADHRGPTGGIATRPPDAAPDGVERVPASS